MAFVNDVLREDEIREYRISEYQVIKPGAGTIDRERNMKLFYTGHPHEDMSVNYFLFVWNELKIDVVLHRTITENTNTVTWKLKGISLTRNMLNRSGVLEDLREAMRVYGYCGYSIFKCGEVNVEINF